MRNNYSSKAQCLIGKKIINYIKIEINFRVRNFSPLNFEILT